MQESKLVSFRKNQNLFDPSFASVLPPNTPHQLHSSMVLDESFVLPAEVALDPADDEGDECFESPVARPSRPFEDTDWTDQDHFYDGDLPEESCPGE